MNLQTKDSAATGIGRGCCRAARFAGTMACGLGLLVAVHHDVSPAFAQEQIEAGPRIAGATIALDTKAVPVPRAAASSRMPPSAVEHRIRLTGIIRPGDADRLREVLAGFRMPATAVPGRSLATIELSSLGGNLVEGLKIGYLLKEFGVVAVVRSGDTCLSACALAFLGGNDRNAPSVPSDRCNLEIGGKVA